MRPKVFRFRYFTASWFVIGGLSILVAGLGAASVARGRAADGLLFIAIGLFILAGLSGATMWAISDIVVDDRHIARGIFGLEWGALPWKSVERIEVFFVPAFDRGKMAKALRFYPYDNLTGGANHLKPMWFSEQFTDLSDLFTIIDQFVAEYAIKVFLREDGTLRPISRV